MNGFVGRGPIDSLCVAQTAVTLGSLAAVAGVTQRDQVRAVVGTARGEGYIVVNVLGCNVPTVGGALATHRLFVQHERPDPLPVAAVTPLVS